MPHKLIMLLGWLYLGTALCLSVFGINLLVLTGLTLYHRLRAKGASLIPAPPAPSELPDPPPFVTIQLPLYNEQQVASRLIDAVAQIDYPSSHLQIQVLDDSTDETRAIVDERILYWQGQGRWIEAVRRKDRQDYKAGALRFGLQSATGEYIAIFDADFVPPPDWLRRALGPFFEPGSERIGVVQTRWGHLNEEYSALTRAQALALDGHFMIEQNGRAAAGLFLTFNGTAGIWRRACIEAAGNWRGLTLSEDLDLSYRAQLQGWKICYRPDITVPAEIPILMAGLKRQQFRWAKGTVQVARLLGPEVLHAPISPWHKLQGILHLTAYMAHPMMVLIFLIMLPLYLEGSFFRQNPAMGVLGVASLGAPVLYAVSQTMLYGSRSLPGRWLKRMPLLLLLGMGIAVNNSRAVLEALFGVRSPFERTPKSGIQQQDRKWLQSRRSERLKVNPYTWLELALAAYTGLIAALMLQQRNWAGVSFAVLATIGFSWVFFATVLEARRS